MARPSASPPPQPFPTYRFEVCALASVMHIDTDPAGRLLRVQLIAPDVHALGSARGVVQVWRGGGDEGGWVEVLRREAVIRSSPHVDPEPISGPVDPREVEARIRALVDGLRADAGRILDHPVTKRRPRRAGPGAELELRQLR